MTLEEVQAALRTAARPDAHDPGFRVEEICEATGLGEAAARKMIRQGLQAGTVVRSRRTIERLDCRLAPVTTYVFLDGAA